MLQYKSIFYGDLKPDGFQITYLLLQHKIRHEFVLFEHKYVWHIETHLKTREFVGFEQIKICIESYKYLFEFPEITQWNY